MKAGTLISVLCLLGCQLWGEETFDLPAYPVEAGLADSPGLQPAGIDAELVSTRAMAAESLVEALKESVSLRVRHFLGGNNEPIVRFRAYGSQSIPTTRGLEHRASLYHLGAEGRKTISRRLIVGGLMQVRHQRSRAGDEWDRPTHPGFQAVGEPLDPLPHVPFAYDDYDYNFRTKWLKLNFLSLSGIPRVHLCHTSRTHLAWNGLVGLWSGKRMGILC